MEGFTQFCVWFLFAAVVVELAWKGWNKYQEEKLKEKELEEKNKNKD